MTVSIDGTLGVTSPQVVITNGTSTVTLVPPASGTLTGVPLFQSTSGAITLTNSTGGSLVLQPAAGSTTATTLAFPNGVGTNGQVLSSNGSGGMTWASGGGTPAGAPTQVQFNNAGAFGASANLVWNNTNGYLGVGTAAPVSALTISGAYSATAPGILTLDGQGNIAVLGFYDAASTRTDKSPVRLVYDIGNSFAGLYAADANLAMQTDTAFPLIFATNNIRRMFIDGTTGYVGIGTQTPTAALHVAGDLLLGTAASTAPTLSLTNATNANNVSIKSGVNTAAWTLTLPTGPGTAGQVLKTDGAGITSWQADSAAAGGATTQVQYNSTGSLAGAAGFTFNGTSTVALGVAGTSTGTITLAGSTSGVVTVKPAAIAGTWSLTLPASGGTNGYYLQTDGSGNTTWAAVAGSGTVNSGTANQLAYYSATGTAVSGSANITASSGALTLGVAGSADGSVVLSGSTSGAVTVKTAAAAGTWSLTLPASAGTSGGLLQTDGAGVTSWTTPVTGSLVGTTQTQTLTNKRITPRVSSAASITSPLAVNSDNFDQYCATAQAANLTISADSGTPTDGQKLTFRFKDNGTARTLTWTSGSGGYRAIGITLPTTTTAGKLTYVGFVYNAADSFWDGVATVTQA